MTLPSPRAISSTSAKDAQATEDTKSAPMMNKDADAKSGGRSSLASMSYNPNALNAFNKSVSQALVFCSACIT
ncbi:hypothetical protein MesoLj113b_61120 [Mesorhizobium sp. 113-3-3]|nr:hypothetical protein MesoLj113b_61120 [Mesorhizobium sp. 113-3-3]